MKRILLSFVAIATISLSSFGQAPEGFKYQAVVRDAGNTILNNQAVGMQIEILQGGIAGTPVYTESFAPTTNNYGLVNLEIGTGTTTDDFTTIDWANDTYFVRTSIDVTGGSSYVVMGTSQLMSVPYALHAKTAESSIIDNVDDADADPLNEMNTSVVLNGTDLETTDGNGTIVTDLSSLVDDADADATNELQNIEQVLVVGNDANGNNIVNTGQIGIGTATPNAESSIEIATALPVVFPSMTQAQVDALTAPVEGMVQYNTTANKLQVYTSSSSNVFGNNTTTGSGTCLTSSPLWFTPTVSGFITQIQLYHAVAGESASIAVKEDFCGTANLVGNSDYITVNAGWNTWTFVAPVPVTAGTTYYITSDDATGCLGVAWSGTGDDPTTGGTDTMFGCMLNSFDPASQITVVSGTTGWVDLH